MRTILLKEVRAELATRRDTRVVDGAGQRWGRQPLALCVGAPMVLAGALAVLWF
ncbi:MAG: hypothetical protein OEM91_12385 [Hyphomicrobiales bacterium]|nr:hypothetical protein [Hyphomicrobiales bacterium]